MISSYFSRSVFQGRRLLGVGLALAAPAVMRAAEAAPAEVQFMRDIAPILAQNCFVCHGAKEHEGELRLDIFENMIEGDHPAVVPGQPEESEMVSRITEEDASSRMPRDGDPLTPEQIELIRRWIKAGAKFDGPDTKTPYKATPDARQSGAAPAGHRTRPAMPVVAKAREESAAGNREAAAKWSRPSL